MSWVLCGGLRALLSMSWKGAVNHQARATWKAVQMLVFSPL